MSSGSELTSTVFRIRRVAARGVDLNEDGKAVLHRAGRNVHEKTKMSGRPTPNGVNMHEKTANTGASMRCVSVTMLTAASVDDEMSLPSAAACIMRQVSSFSYPILRAKPFINCSTNKRSRSRQISHPRCYAIRSNFGSRHFQS